MAVPVTDDDRTAADGGPPVADGGSPVPGEVSPAPGGGQWYDSDAGPLVRPYASTPTPAEAAPAPVAFDLIATVTARDPDTGPAEGAPLGSEHMAVLRLCARGPQALADLAAGAGLPLGAVRVLVGDLATSGHVTVREPVPPARLPGEEILMEVIDGLRAL